MLPRYIREMRRCNINASHEIFVAVLPFISLALRTLYSGRGCGLAGGGREGVGVGESAGEAGGFGAERVGGWRALRGARKASRGRAGEHRPSRPPPPPPPSPSSPTPTIFRLPRIPLPLQPPPRSRLGTTGLTYILQLATLRARVS